MHSVKSYFSPAPAPPEAAGSQIARKPSKKGPKPQGAGPASDIPLEMADTRWSAWSGSQVDGRSGSGSRAASRADMLAEMKADVTVTHIYMEQLKLNYAMEHHLHEGVVVKRSRNNFVCAPPELRELPNGFYDMICQLNVSAAITVNTPFVRSLIDVIIRKDVDSIPLKNGMNLQALPRMTDLPHCQKHHFAAFVLDAGVLVVWDDDPFHVLKRANNIMEDIVKLVWGTGEEEDDEDEKKDAKVEANEYDVEEAGPEKRPLHLTASLTVMLTMILSLSCLAIGWRWLAVQITVDGDFTRLGLIAAAPFMFFLGLFFFQTMIGSILEIIGPISCVLKNSRNYSGLPPRRLNRAPGDLPHVTIQMPVYKEGLNGVIRPTITSIKAAVSTYEMQGGTANIFINDDGMQLLPEDEAQARRDFYEEHNIGWVSRPKHEPKPSQPGVQPFLRKGKFKKASNMNYALHVSVRVEEKLKQIRRYEGWNQGMENEAYSQALAQVLEEDEGRTWAEGNVRVGDYILIIDSDTRVPADCFMDAVSEMEMSPEVAIIQHTSGLLQVSDSFFEAGVMWFTNLIYTSITFAVANGDICPFVGHNAFLRWSAIQDGASWTDEDDGREKWWSESHVSEDFDMALRLQAEGYIMRFATYSNGGFEEGVSLTVYDELARWEKYAFGCAELLFNPVRTWLYKGPFAPLFKRFIFSQIRLAQKITIMAYIGTYFAIGISWIMIVANYFLTGWFFGYLDKFYLDSFAIYFAIVIVFQGLGTIALAVLRYRLGQRSLIRSLGENLLWLPLFTIFLGGISIHVSKAILCHLFEINITWGATGKEVERVNFMQEIPKIVKNFAGTFVFCFASAALMICGAFVFPREWQIRAFASIYPYALLVVSHFSLPVLLNPALMKFSF